MILNNVFEAQLFANAVYTIIVKWHFAIFNTEPDWGIPRD